MIFQELLKIFEEIAGIKTNFDKIQALDFHSKLSKDVKNSIHTPCIIESMKILGLWWTTSFHTTMETNNSRMLVQRMVIDMKRFQQCLNKYVSYFVWNKNILRTPSKG